MRRPALGDNGIPEASAEQLKAMRRVGRPRIGDKPRRLIAIREWPSARELKLVEEIV